MFLGECKYPVKKKMPKYIAKDREISSDELNKEYSEKENSQQNFDEENFDKKIRICWKLHI